MEGVIFGVVTWAIWGGGGKRGGGGGLWRATHYKCLFIVLSMMDLQLSDSTYDCFLSNYLFMDLFTDQKNDGTYFYYILDLLVWCGFILIVWIFL